MLLFGVLNGEWLSVDWMDMAQEPSIHDNGLGVGHLCYKYLVFVTFEQL